jgi:hypothetical protein
MGSVGCVQLGSSETGNGSGCFTAASYGRMQESSRMKLKKAGCRLRLSLTRGGDGRSCLAICGESEVQGFASLHVRGQPSLLQRQSLRQSANAKCSLFTLLPKIRNLPTHDQIWATLNLEPCHHEPLLQVQPGASALASPRPPGRARMK